MREQTHRNAGRRARALARSGTRRTSARSCRPCTSHALLLNRDRVGPKRRRRTIGVRRLADAERRVPHPRRRTHGRRWREYADVVADGSSASTEHRPSSTPSCRPCCSRTSSGRREKQASLGDHGWKEPRRTAPRGRPRCARTLARGRERHGRRRLLRDVRRSGPGDPVRHRKRRRTSGLGLEIRAGVHTGECEVIDGKIGGLSVSIGARVASKAGPSEVLDLADGEGPRRGQRPHASRTPASTN